MRIREFAKEIGSSLLQLLAGAIIATAVAIPLRIVVGLPVEFTFAFLFLFLVIYEIRKWFGDGLRIAGSWLRTAVRLLVAFVSFLTLRFLVGQVFKVYPVDTRTDWGKSRGFYGVFWGHEASQHIVYEVLITSLLLCIVVGLLRRKFMGRLLSGVATFILIVILVAGVLFPMWSSTWGTTRNELDQSLAKDGLIATIKDAMPKATDDVSSEGKISSDNESDACDYAKGRDTDLRFDQLLDPDTGGPISAFSHPIKVFGNDVDYGNGKCWGKVIYIPTSFIAHGFCWDWSYPKGASRKGGENLQITVQFVSVDPTSGKVTPVVIRGPFGLQDVPVFNDRVYPPTFRLRGDATPEPKGGILLYARPDDGCKSGQV